MRTEGCHGIYQLEVLKTKVWMRENEDNSVSFMERFRSKWEEKCGGRGSCFCFKMGQLALSVCFPVGLSQWDGRSDGGEGELLTWPVNQVRWDSGMKAGLPVRRSEVCTQAGCVVPCGRTSLLMLRSIRVREEKGLWEG